MKSVMNLFSTDTNSDADEEELHQILSNAPPPSDAQERDCGESPSLVSFGTVPSSGDSKFTSKSVQWSTFDGKIFIPTGTTVGTLSPGYYEINSSPDIGIYFELVPVKTDGILQVPDANTHKVIEEIKKFWDREEIFRSYNLTYTRGIMLWGPAGGGKSSTLQLVSRDVIERGGIVIKFENPYHFSIGIRKLREIQPDTPVVVLMEDIDSTVRVYNETVVLNIIDGVDRMDKIVFLATTNYPELLGDRIMNRPSRFDKRYKVGFPSAAARQMYFEFLKGDNVIPEMDNIAQWVEDTENFSVAHMKELFVAVVVLGDEYDSAVKTLKAMKTVVTSGNDGDSMGLRTHASEKASVDFRKLSSFKIPKKRSPIYQ